MSEKPKLPEEPGCPLWMLSFGDSISLLVTFFVLLISFSELEEAKLLELMGALKGGFRVTLSSNPTLGTSRDAPKLEKSVGGAEGQTLVPKQQASKVPAYERMMQKTFSANAIGSYDKGYILRLLDEGLSFIVRTDDIFAPNSAELLPKKEDVLSVVADLAADLSNEIRMVGVMPAGEQVKSDLVTTPWGLAAERAMVLKDIMVENMSFPEDRFSLGVRVEGEDELLVTRKEHFPSDRMEIVIVGFRDLSRLEPDNVIIRDQW